MTPDALAFTFGAFSSGAIGFVFVAKWLLAAAPQQPAAKRVAGKPVGEKQTA